MGLPLCVICCFTLAAFNIFYLCLIFINLNNICLGMLCLGFFLFGTLWVSWTWVVISFPILGKFSTIISSSIFSWPFFLFSSSGTPMIQMLGHITLSQRSPNLSLFFFYSFFFFFSLCFIYFHHSIFHLTYPIFCLSYSTVGSLQSAFDLSYSITSDMQMTPPLWQRVKRN